MTSLGDILELIFARPDAGVSVHAVAHERRDPELAQRVAEQFEKQLPRVASPGVAFWAGVRLMTAPIHAVETLNKINETVRRDPPEPGPLPESELTIWLNASGRARLERIWSTPTGTERLATVVTTRPAGQDIRLRDLWRSRKDRQSRLRAPTATDAERLFDHQLLREILSCLVLEAPQEDEIAGRQVVVVRATRRPPLGLWPHWLPFGADRYELAFDCEFGSMLAFSALTAGRVYEATTVAEISYGDPIDERLLAAS